MRRVLPPHGAPQYDSRENERPDMCCACDCDPDTCGRSVPECEQAAEEAIAEDVFEARREAYE